MRFLTFLASLFCFSPLICAQDSDSDSQASSDYAPQSEIVTVMNEVNEKGEYVIGRSKDGFPTVTFRMTAPAGVQNFYNFSCFYKNGYSGTVDGFAQMYVQSKYANILTQVLQKYTTVYADGEELGAVFTSSCVVRDADGSVVRDYTLEFRDLGSKNFFALKGSDFKVTLSPLAIMCRDENKVKSILQKYAEATYSFVSDGYKPVIEVSNTVKLSELNNIADTSSLYLNAGSMLIVDGNLTCKNIYVEAADEVVAGLPAGIVINSGASLTADSVYFLANFEDERSVGYLINNGACSAGMVFMKNAQNTKKLDEAYAFRYGYTEKSTGVVLSKDSWFNAFPSFSSPVNKRDGWVNMTYRVKMDNKHSYYTTGLWTPFLDFKDKYRELANVTEWADYFKAEEEFGNSIPFFAFHTYTNSEVLRVDGEVNDEESYTLPVKNLSAAGEPSLTYVNNPFPAPVDWRSVAEDAIEAEGDDSFISDIRDIQYGFVKHSLYSIYNFKTGITTLDVPNKMYYGYIQPNMTNVSLPCQTGERSSVLFTKSNLTTYQQADEKYADTDYTNGLPYIRLYVDEVVDSLAKGVGRRSVVALYFVPKEQFDELHSLSCADYDSVFDVNNLWESLAETRFKSFYHRVKFSLESNFGGGPIFPYIGAYGVNQKSDSVAAAIKMVAIPESVEGKQQSTKQYIEAESILKDFIGLSIEPKIALDASGAVKFGVVDYDLKDSNIGIRVGGLSLNYPGQADCLDTTIGFTDGYSEDGLKVKGFSPNKKFCEWDCRTLRLNLNVAKGIPDPASDKKTNVDAVKLTSAHATISVSTECAGQLRVFDILGRLVAERSVVSGSATVAVPAGAYVANFAAGKSSCVKALVVK